MVCGKSGISGAQNNLGILYYAGRGVERNIVIALWASVAASDASGGDQSKMREVQGP